MGIRHIFVTHQEFINLHLFNIKYHIEYGILFVAEGLDLQNRNIESLPDNIIFSSFLDLEGSTLEYLPDNLLTGGFLDVSETCITKLPDNLTVHGDLLLRDTEVKILPDDLKFDGWFNIRNTKITYLPDSVELNDIVLFNNKLKMSKEKQLDIITKDKYFFNIIKNPTKKAVSLQKLMWKI